MAGYEMPPCSNMEDDIFADMKADRRYYWWHPGHGKGFGQVAGTEGREHRDRCTRSIKA